MTYISVCDVEGAIAKVCPSRLQALDTRSQRRLVSQRNSYSQNCYETVVSKKRLSVSCAR